MSTIQGELNTPREATMQRIAKGIEDLARGGDSTAIDATYEAMLDGTNTTHVFWSWWPLSDNGDSKFQRLERFGRMLAAAWEGKRYTLRYLRSTSGTGDPTMTPLDDLVGKSAAQLCTEHTMPVADWADEDPMTWYIHANALSLADGSMNVIAVEGEDDFDDSGEAAPVWTFALALWVREWDDEDYSYKSWATEQPGGYHPYAGDVSPDNHKRVLTWRPTYPGGLNSAGALTSGAGRKPYILAAATAGIAKARAMDAYEGLWNDADTIWALDMWQLRHFNLENSGVCEGCINYNFQYTAALAEDDVRRVLITPAEAANLIVGSNIDIGDMGSETSRDRTKGYVRNIAQTATILAIDSVTIGGVEYAAVTVDTEETFNTTLTTLISTMPWNSGVTEALPGHKDGAIHSLVAGMGPMRVMGVELLSGAYDIGLDPLYNVTANATSGFDYAVYECKDSTKLSGSITANYSDTGIRGTGIANGWNYVKKFVRTTLAVLFPEVLGGSSSTFFKSAFYGASPAGVRCPWRFGALTRGANGGLACEYGDCAPSSANWYGRPRLSGSGKKRGEWAA